MSDDRVFFGHAPDDFTLPDPPSGFGSGKFGDGDFGVFSTADAQDEETSGYLFAEDYGLKLALEGLVVSDQSNANRPVTVYFGQPDPEIRAQNYPYIVIDLIDIVENTPQVHNTYGPLDDPRFSYLKDYPAFDGQDYGAGPYLVSPVLLVYQVSAWSRQIRHDRQMIQQLQSGPLHPRYGQIWVPANSTGRRVVITNFAKRDTTDNESKRIYRDIWTIQIPSEVFYGELDLTQRAQAVIINNENLPRTPPSSLAQTVSYPS